MTPTAGAIGGKHPLWDLPTVRRLVTHLARKETAKHFQNGGYSVESSAKKSGTVFGLIPSPATKSEATINQGSFIFQQNSFTININQVSPLKDGVR